MKTLFKILPKVYKLNITAINIPRRRLSVYSYTNLLPQTNNI